jgi:hypothetical protein
MMLMKFGEVILVAAIVSVIIFFILKGFRPVEKKSATETTAVVEVIEEPPIAPYWTVYGLPSYWPPAISPYLYYNSPYWGYGPYDGIGRSSGYRGQREIYAPHGWGINHSGYSGVAVGGGGGGGGHGGH